MKIFRIPSPCSAIIFDIDSTLYTNPTYAFEQVDIQVRYFAKLRNIPDVKARQMIHDYRTQWSKEHDGKKISLGNTLTAFDIPIEQSVEWRKALLEPKEFLQADEHLQKTLEELSKRFKMICVTNNPVLPAFKTLEAIGIEKIIPDIIGLDTCFKSKPAKEPFLKAVEKLNVNAAECISIGDRYDMDLALPLDMGMGGILVSSVDDVYQLPEIL